MSQTAASVPRCVWGLPRAAGGSRAEVGGGPRGIPCRGWVGVPARRRRSRPGRAEGGERRAVQRVAAQQRQVRPSVVFSPTEQQQRLLVVARRVPLKPRRSPLPPRLPGAPGSENQGAAAGRPCGWGFSPPWAIPPPRSPRGHRAGVSCHLTSVSLPRLPRKAQLCPRLEKSALPSSVTGNREPAPTALTPSFLDVRQRDHPAPPSTVWPRGRWGHRLAARPCDRDRTQGGCAQVGARLMLTLVRVGGLAGPPARPHHTQEVTSWHSCGAARHRAHVPLYHRGEGRGRGAGEGRQKGKRGKVQRPRASVTPSHSAPAVRTAKLRWGRSPGLCSDWASSSPSCEPGRSRARRERPQPRREGWECWGSCRHRAIGLRPRPAPRPAPPPQRQTEPPNCPQAIPDRGSGREKPPHLDHGVKGGGEVPPELLPDVEQVDLAPGHDHADEGVVVGPCALGNGQETHIA